MSSIDLTQRLHSALQSQLARVRDRARAGAARTASPRAPPARADAAGLAQRIEAIPRDAPNRQRQAVRVYLESELAREFGSGLLNDPAFPRMLDDIQEQMQDDAQTAAAVQALGDLLLARAAR
jgi:hypothetical protein